MSDQKPLRNLRALVMEDEYFVADDLRQVLLRRGADVVQLCGSVQEAIAHIGTEYFNFALLDINMRGEMNFRVADECLQRRVPFAFVSGYDKTFIPPRFHDVPNWGKPYDERQIVAYIEVCWRAEVKNQQSRPHAALHPGSNTR